MPIRIKIYLGLFTAVAVLIVTGAFLDFKNIKGLEARVAAVLGLDPETGELINNPSKPSDDPFENDIDKDGIKDELESIYGTNATNPDTDGDGFLDGEEIASGCDPLDGNREKDCPESYIKYLARFEENDRNITNEIAELSLIGLQVGDLSYDDPQAFYENLQNIQLKALDDTGKLFVLDEAEHNLIVSDDNSPEAIREYHRQITNLATVDLAQAIPHEQIDVNLIFQAFETDNSGLFIKYKDAMKILYLKGSQITVPSSWTDIHRNILTLTKKYEVFYGSLAKSSDDPLRALAALGVTGDLDTDYRNLIIKIIDRVNEQGIPPPQDTISWLLVNAGILNLVPNTQN